MKSFIIILCLVASAFCLSYHDPEDEGWETYKAKFDKTYETEADDRLRYTIYLESKRKVTEHNKGYKDGKNSFYIGINKFSDMLPKEFELYRTGYKASQKIKGVTTYKRDKTQILPDSVNWSDVGAVTDVKDQGLCGASWAFSATGTLEGAHFLQTGELVSLSEQNLIDCVKINSGCMGGGFTDAAFNYVKNNDGIDTEESYPFVGKDQPCSFDLNNVGATCTGFVDIATGNEDALTSAVANIGPVSAAIDASQTDFQAYSGGVYRNSECDSSAVNHAVLIIGYGTTTAGEDYWLVKNSWGTSWGLDGYFYIARNDGNMCGVASSTSYVTV